MFDYVRYRPTIGGTTAVCISRTNATHCKQMKRFDEAFVPEYITALVSGLIGVISGNLFVHRVSQRGFMRLILVLLLFGGVMLLL